MAFITLSKENFYHNLNEIVLKTGSKDKIFVVLKDNAYGHGLYLMAKMASSFGIKRVVVRTTKEAKEIEDLFDYILILDDKIENNHYTYVINSLEDIKNAKINSRVELKIDTGMHRNGITFDELEEALALIKEKKLNFFGVMTHYRSADVLSSEFFWQQKNFDKVKKYIISKGYTNIYFHSHNSSSILRTNNFNEDFVRVGIAIYGFNELPNMFNKSKLKPILSLYADKISSRDLKKGQRVGYGGDFIAPKDMRVSTYNLGYGDGWFRGEYLHKRFVTAENLSILGRVSMDSIILESTKDKICIMNNAQKVAKQLNTISYEITTSLTTEIKRVVI